MVKKGTVGSAALLTPLNGAKPVMFSYTDANGLRIKIALDDAGLWFCEDGEQWTLATLQQLFNDSQEWYVERNGKKVRAKPGDMTKSQNDEDDIFAELRKL